MRSNNDQPRRKLDLLVEQIGTEHHWIKVEQKFEYQTYFARYSICCKCLGKILGSRYSAAVGVDLGTSKMHLKQCNWPDKMPVN